MIRQRSLLRAWETCFASTAAWWMTVSVCVVSFVFHFTCIQLANMPLSPLKLKYANQLDAYVNPFFTQRWNFFAPQPLDRDMFLIARARFRRKQDMDDH